MVDLWLDVPSGVYVYRYPGLHRKEPRQNRVNLLELWSLMAFEVSDA